MGDDIVFKLSWRQRLNLRAEISFTQWVEIFDSDEMSKMHEANSRYFYDGE